jgi:MoxR-like ATPase
MSVLRHRILPNFAAEAEGIDSVRIVKELLQSVPEPKE